MYVHTHICKRICKSITQSVYLCFSVNICAHKRVGVYYICMYTHTHTHTHTHIYIYIYIYINIFQLMYIYIHTYIYDVSDHRNLSSTD